MISRSKLVTLLLTGALVVGVGVAGIVGPAAASGSGTAYVTPGAGNPDTALTMNTNGYCPAGDTNGDVQVSGTGVTTSHPYIYGNSALPVAGVSGYSVAMSQTMSTFASEQNPPATLSGTYVFTFNCLQTSTSLSPDHVFVGTIVFQGSGNDSTNTYTNTATTLAASPSRSAASRSDVTFTATVSPANAAGQVQFMDGTTDLGAPVKVSGGRAVYETSALAAGSHRITATFGPLRSDSSGSWGPSASAVLLYAVTAGTGPAPAAPVFVPTVWGTVKLGSTVDCVQAVAHATAKSWSWYENGHKIAGATGWQYKIPSSLKGERLACALSAKNSAGTTAETSTAVKAHAVAVLRSAMSTPAPVFVPTVWGTSTVGSTVACVQAVSHATSTSWSWYENGLKIAGATGPQYKIPSSLKGQRLGCELSAKNHAGTTTGTSATGKVAG